MKLRNSIQLVLFSSFLPLFTPSLAEGKPQGPLTEEGYNKSAISVVKLIIEQGHQTGAGVLVGLERNGGGAILTSYNLVAGQSEVAVAFKDHPNPVVGKVEHNRIDLNLDLALVSVKELPPGLKPVFFEQTKFGLMGETLTIIGHTEDQDWAPVEVQISDENLRHLECSVGGVTGIDGAPLVNHHGKLVGLVVSDAVQKSADYHVTLVVKSRVMKPTVNMWLDQLSLTSKWQEQKTGWSPWIWALGGGFLGGGVAAAITLSGSGNESARGLPRPPQPPGNP